MLMVISPAKTLDFDTPPKFKKFTQPEFLQRSEQLIARLRHLSPDRIGSLMAISPALSELNHRRFKHWSVPFNAGNAKQAVLAFRGDVYQGLDADSFSATDLNFAQKHLRMLSGLYGLLKPLDLIQPYRLEMGTSLDGPHGRNLYEFWGETLTQALNAELARLKVPVLVNLASEEYFKAVHPKSLAATVITPIFKERKGGSDKIVSFYAKRARGLMSAFLIKQRVTNPDLIKQFNGAGYSYQSALSDAQRWVFTREQPI